MTPGFTCWSHYLSYEEDDPRTQDVTSDREWSAGQSKYLRIKGLAAPRRLRDLIAE